MSSPRSGSLKGILFDLDGTLIATRRLYVESFADALEPVLGERLSEEQIMARKPRAERRFLRELAGDQHVRATLERFYASYETRHEASFEGIYPGVRPLLQALRQRQVPIGLVTGKSRRSWRITGPRIGLGDFAVTVFDEDVPAPKPDPTGLQLALDALRMDPDRVVYVGDSVTDLEAARALGMPSGAVLWSKKAHERQPFSHEGRELGARVLDHPSRVLRLLDGEDGPEESTPGSGA